MPSRSAGLDSVLTRVHGTFADELRRLVAAAVLERPVVVDVAAAAASVFPYTWLLRRLGPQGVRLTSAGYLPPAVVREAMRELGWSERWIGTHNREHSTLPVLELRDSARRFGLVRKYRGLLLPTARGAELTDDPVGLWWLLAGRMPDARDDAEEDAGWLLLLRVAAGEAFDHRGLDEFLRRGLTALGWRGRDGGPLGEHVAFGRARETWTFLRRLQVLPSTSFRSAPVKAASAGVAFARASLRGRAGI